MPSRPLSRGRGKLFSAGNDTIEEDQALDDAMYALRALQSAADASGDC